MCRVGRKEGSIPSTTIPLKYPTNCQSVQICTLFLYGERRET
nr:MAG TPA: hypothetical protein [Caudoviricetes sp.]DAS86741.1 MAG TPA: hypothetical protein [Caudoviricetes sp.]